MDIVKEGNFKPVGKELVPDDRKRVALGAVMPAVMRPAFAIRHSGMSLVRSSSSQ